jgi:hypothetical protein
MDRAQDAMSLSASDPSLINHPHFLPPSSALSKIRSHGYRDADTRGCATDSSSVSLSFLFHSVYDSLGDNLPGGTDQMKKLLILLFSICALGLAQHPARAQCVSWGIPLPFPFLFLNFGPSYAQPYYGGYGYRPYYARPYYYRSCYYRGYYRPRYYGPRYYGPGW